MSEPKSFCLKALGVLAVGLRLGTIWTQIDETGPDCPTLTVFSPDYSLRRAELRSMQIGLNRELLGFLSRSAADP